MKRHDLTNQVNSDFVRVFKDYPLITPKTGEDRPDITHNSVWRLRNGEVVIARANVYGHWSGWNRQTRPMLIIARSDRDFRGDDGPEYELTEYIGQLEDLVSLVLGDKPGS